MSGTQSSVNTCPRSTSSSLESLPVLPSWYQPSDCRRGTSALFCRHRTPTGVAVVVSGLRTVVERNWELLLRVVSCCVVFWAPVCLSESGLFVRP